jgi:predicted nucleic acid-binding protein
MASLNELRGKAVYLDTNIFIYMVEGYAAEQPFIRALAAAIDRQELVAVTSELTLAELLVKPLELGRADVVAIYEELLQHSDRLTVPPVDRATLIEAARLRARLGILLADAIHVATAALAGCAAFLTNDRRLKLPAGLALVGLA